MALQNQIMQWIGENLFPVVFCLAVWSVFMVWIGFVMAKAIVPRKFLSKVNADVETQKILNDQETEIKFLKKEIELLKEKSTRQANALMSVSATILSALNRE